MPRTYEGRGGLLDNLLVPALDGALPFRQCHDGAPPIPEYLHLDVPGALHVLLYEHSRVPKASLPLPAANNLCAWLQKG